MTTIASFCDADSHLMESHGWLASYADPSVRKRFQKLDLAVAGAGADKMIEAGLARMVTDPPGDLDRSVLSGAKGWLGIGAMDPTERSLVLDAVGITQQLVFSTFSSLLFAFAKDEDLVYGGTRAHNRGITEFCSADPRLLPVGLVPLVDVERSVAALDEAIAMGCRAIWVPNRLAGGVSPGHLQWDPFWARLAAARVPFVLHVGGGRSTLPSGFHDNGQPLPPDMLGGGENLRGKDFPSLHHAAETFLSVLILDGAFDRHPELRGGVIELGASWVPSFLHGLDAAKRNFGRNEPVLSALELDPSDYVRRHLRFTPFPFDDVGWLIQQAGSDLFLFSTDYPHPEGGRDPIGKFTASMDAVGLDPESQTGFWADNFHHLFNARQEARV